MLTENPNILRTVVVVNPDVAPVVVTVGIRGIAPFALEIPAAGIGALELLNLIERHCATVQ